MLRGLIILLAIFLTAGEARADECTPGDNCFCDCLTDTGGATGTFKNASCQAKGYARHARTVLCEDAEAPGYRVDAADGTGAWSDEGGFAGSRGCGSDWADKYVQGQAGCGWVLNTPDPATRGAPLTSLAGGYCPGDWSPSDTWQINARACIDVHYSGDSVASGLDTPTIHDGAAIYGSLQPPGGSDSAGSSAWSPKSTIAVTRARRYSSNYLTQKHPDCPIKEDEYTTGGNANHHLDLMASFVGSDSEFPFRNLLLKCGTFSNPVNDATCEAAAAGATWNVGAPSAGAGNACSCDGSGGGWLSIRPTGYSQSTDWPTGTWGCPRLSLKGLGTSDTEWKVWLGDELIVDIDDLDTTGWDVLIDGVVGDFYVNQNASQCGATPATSQTIARWDDNKAVLGWSGAECSADGGACGVPLTCAAIGFAGGGEPESAPTYCCKQ